MTSIELITWIFAPITLAAFVLSFTFLMLRADEKERMLVSHGARDNEILKDSRKASEKKSKILKKIGSLAEFVLLGTLVLLMIFGFIARVNGNELTLFGKQFKVCASNSMAQVHERNQDYAADLNNRFALDDLLVIQKLPEESELKQFDIVTYLDNKTGQTIIHRIIAIKQTPQGVSYTLRGDANPVSDKDISYSDMTGIYRGEKLTGVGAFIRFVQSPFSVIALLSCVYICVLEEILQRRLKKADAARLNEILTASESEVISGEPGTDIVLDTAETEEYTQTLAEREQREEILAERRRKQEEEKARRAGKWEILEDGEKYRFRLYDEYGDALCRSEAYASKKQCHNKIKLLGETIRAGRYEIYKDRRGIYQLKLYTTNRRLLILGETHRSRVKAAAAVEAIGRLSQTAELLEATAP